MTVNVHRGFYIMVPHDLLNHLDIALIFTETGAECMTEDMRRKLWQQLRFLSLFLGTGPFLVVITVNDPAYQGVNPRRCKRHSFKCVEYEVRISLYPGIPRRSCQSVIFPLLCQLTANIHHQRDFPLARIRVPKGQKAVIKAHAESQGESMNDFVVRAIDEAIEQDAGKSSAEE